MVLTYIRFSRPHTIIATSLQVVGLFIIAGGLEQFSAERIITLLVALISCLGVNIYIVGLNQLADIEIDRINKPDLPLASGALTIRQGRRLVVLAGLLTMLLAATQGIYLLSTIIISFIVGTVYSLPPLHLKRFPIAAAVCIAFVRGFVANTGLFLHYWQNFGSEGLTPEIPWTFVVAVSLFFFGFGLVIALYKDIPDLAGDKRYGIRTFTVRLGPERVFRIGRWLLTVFYVVPIGLALLEIGRPANIALIVAHFLALLFFWQKSLAVRPEDTRSMTRFYLILWSLFYAEYIILSVRQLVA